MTYIQTIFKTLFFLSLISATRLGATTDSGAPSSKLKSAQAVTVETKFEKNAEIKLLVKKGFHINEKAPNRLVLLNPEVKVAAKKIGAQEVSFVTPIIHAATKLELHAYVCDDALTICEEHVRRWDGSGKEVTTFNADKAKMSQRIKDNSAKESASLSRGLEQCKRNKKPVMLVFTARWCPGCMRMEKEVWTNKNIKSVLNKFNQVKLDADRYANRILMDEYKVAAIPSMLILNCDGQELERFLDYQEPQSFALTLKRISADKNLKPQSELEKAALAGDRHAATLLGQRFAYAGANDEALKWFDVAQINSGNIYYWWAKISKLSKTAGEKNGKVLLTDALRKALLDFPNIPSSLDWQTQLIETLGAESSESQKLATQLLNKCDDLLANPEKMKAFNAGEPAGDFTGIEFLKIYYAKAEALGYLKRSDDEKKAWSAAVAEWDRQGFVDEPSGQFFRFLVFLKKSKNEERLNQFFIKHLRKDPKNGELLRRYAQTLFDFENYEQAAYYANLAIEHSYDRNEIFAAKVYAQSLAKLNRTKDAKEFLLKYLAKTDLPEAAKKEVESLVSVIK